MNHHIRKSPVRLIDHDGTQVGVVPIEEARRRAEQGQEAALRPVRAACLWVVLLATGTGAAVAEPPLRV